MLSVYRLCGLSVMRYIMFSSVICRVAQLMNITTTTTILSNVQLDDNIRMRLLEEEEFIVPIQPLAARF